MGPATPQPAKSRNRDEEIAELESPEGENDRGAHGFLPQAVLFDRDDTLIVDVPYNGDPDRVVPVPGARAAVDRVRALGIPVGVITNQSGIALGRITSEQVAAVNARVDDILGPFTLWRMCPHSETHGCPCRKPMPGMLLSAAESLDIDPCRIVFIGDIGADMEAAQAAGARGILVPTRVTRQEEIDAAETVCQSIGEAVDVALGAIRVGGAR
ncbi:HAD family hydrolase [Flaviflexus huanghaiensis]|uniref:D-glycero-alpha-D-manno-heptose-1,7-bisphosphate 7-phosphatase n=1 Tax=Flaviflexus huanghaiensis TaxID=1111473 RepID=UPI0030CA54AD